MTPAPRRGLFQGLPLLARLGATGFLFVAALGLYAALRQIQHHHAKNDGQPDLSFVDVLGAYHGADIDSPMRAALSGTLTGHVALELGVDERTALMAWLDDGRAAEMFDDIDLEELAPAEIFAARCATCHTSGGAAPPFATFNDVRPLLSDKQLVATPVDLQWTSLHTHAPGMLSFGLVLCLAALWSRFGARVRSLPLALSGIGLALDVGSWIPARESAVLVKAIVTGGALYTLGTALAIAVVLLDVWWPSRDAGTPSN